MVTERTEALRESEAKLRAMFEQAAVGAAQLTTSTGRFLRVNQKFGDIIGYIPQELLSLDFSSMIHPDDIDPYLDGMKQLAAGENRELRLELRICRKDGGIVWIVLTASSLLMDGETPSTVIAVIQDISERKQAELYQRLSVEVLAILNESSDFQGSIRRVLATVKQATGCDAVGLRLQKGEDFPYFQQNGFSNDFLLTENTLVARNPQDGICHNPDGSVRLECTCGLVLSGKTDPIHPLFTPGGSAWTNDSATLLDLPEADDPRYQARNTCIHQGYASFALIPIRTQRAIVGLLQLNGYSKGLFTRVAIDRLEGIATHIGEALLRHQAEDERRRLMSAISHTSDSIVITDHEGTIQYVNPAFERTTGFTAEEALGKNHGLIKSGKHDKAFYHNQLQTLQAGHTWRGRMTNKRKDGSLFVDDSTLSPVHNAEGQLVNIVVVTRDITADVRMEERLRQSQKMEALATLAGGIAHDFNNILSSVLGFAELVKLDVEGDEEAVSNVDQILSAGLRARELVRHIVTFSRMADVQKQPMEIVSLVKETLKFLRASVPSYIEIRHFFDGAVGPIMADPFQVHQVLMNLFTNAAHAMDTKGGILEVRLKSVDIKTLDKELRPGRYLQLIVSDTGCGIPKDVIDHIFEPFFSTKPRGEGTGMGLAAVYGIIKDMNGTISVQSEPGKGSIIEVMLPEFQRESRPEDGSADLLSLKGKGRILLVDDELPIIRWTRKVLVKLGYDVVGMTDSLESLELFKQDPLGFDLVLTDMTMPRMSGLELSKRITEIRPGLPVILFTGFSKGLTPDKMKECCVHALIMKPMIAGELAQVIRKALGQDIEKIEDKETVDGRIL